MGCQKHKLPIELRSINSTNYIKRMWNVDYYHHYQGRHPMMTYVGISWLTLRASHAHPQGSTEQSSLMCSSVFSVPLSVSLSLFPCLSVCPLLHQFVCAYSFCTFLRSRYLNFFNYLVRFQLWHWIEFNAHCLAQCPPPASLSPPPHGRRVLVLGVLFCSALIKRIFQQVFAVCARSNQISPLHGLHCALQWQKVYKFSIFIASHGYF